MPSSGSTIQRYSARAAAAVWPGVGFFAQQAMVGKGPEHDLADGFLRGQIGLGHQIGRALSCERRIGRPSLGRPGRRPAPPLRKPADNRRSMFMSSDVSHQTACNSVHDAKRMFAASRLATVPGNRSAVAARCQSCDGSCENRPDYPLDRVSFVRSIVRKSEKFLRQLLDNVVETCYYQKHRPLLCSGPAVSLRRERRGFFVGQPAP